MKAPKKREYALRLVRAKLTIRGMYYQAEKNSEDPFNKGMVEGINIAIAEIDAELGEGLTTRRPKR